MKYIILAFQFLTRIPLPFNVEFNEKNLRRSFFFFPLAGFFIGACAGLPLFFSLFNINTAALISLIIYLLITGGLHIDGLSDTADGFFSARGKEKVLQIMADPHVGVFGVTAIMLNLLCRWVLYRELYYIPQYLVFCCGLSRFCAMFVICFTKPAKETGLGILFQRSISKAVFFIWLPLIFSVMPVYYLNFQDIFFMLQICAVIILSLFLTFIITLISNKKIGGTTGDINGCVIECTEIFSMILITVFFA